MEILSINRNMHLMPPPLKRESWSLEDITMFGAAGGAGWSSLEEEAVVETVASSAPAVAVAVTGSTGSEFEIILPSSHFSILPLFYFYFYFFIPLSLSLTRYLLSTSFISLFSLFWSTYSQSKQERPTLQGHETKNPRQGWSTIQIQGKMLWRLKYSKPKKLLLTLSFITERVILHSSAS